MSQNTSSAVMQQRSEPHDSLDDFPTPPWAVRALCEFLRDGPPSEPLDAMTCREPAANRGYMFRALAESFGYVEGFDVHDYGAGFPIADYLFPNHLDPVDWTISNPPFRLAEQFIERAEATSRRGYAMLVRSAFLEGVGRHERLFSANPPAYVLQFTERVVMHKGKVTADGSTATAYCWLVWHRGPLAGSMTRLGWIAPCRKRLERPGDYEIYGTAT